MYQKILDEALTELKDEEFSELYKDEQENIAYVDECQLDTDLEILFPNNYISSISERLALYKELNSIDSEEMLNEFKNLLSDRFGPIPEKAIELIESIKLRWLAKEIGFVRISLKNNLLTGYFPKQESNFFQSNEFGRILDYLKENHQICEMKEVKGKLIFRIKNVDSIHSAINCCKKIRI